MSVGQYSDIKSAYVIHCIISKTGCIGEDGYELYMDVDTQGAAGPTAAASLQDAKRIFMVTFGLCGIFGFQKA